MTGTTGLSKVPPQFCLVPQAEHLRIPVLFIYFSYAPRVLRGDSTFVTDDMWMTVTDGIPTSQRRSAPHNLGCSCCGIFNSRLLPRHNVLTLTPSTT